MCAGLFYWQFVKVVSSADVLTSIGACKKKQTDMKNLTLYSMLINEAQTTAMVQPHECIHIHGQPNVAWNSILMLSAML